MVHLVGRSWRQWNAVRGREGREVRQVERRGKTKGDVDLPKSGEHDLVFDTFLVLVIEVVSGGPSSSADSPAAVRNASHRLL